MRLRHRPYPSVIAEHPFASIDLDLRVVRYFVAVAEHGNFGRAADALHLAQPSLSRQIQSLEQRLGARLFDRTPQGSQLTEAGEAFLPQAQALLRSAHQAASAARAAVAPPTITIGYVGDFIITPATQDLRRRNPDAEIHTRHLDWDEATAALPQRRVDVLIARQPFPFAADDLDLTILYEEPRVLVMPTGHRLARRQSVKLEDFLDEPLIHYPGTDSAWSAFWRLEPRPDGRPAPAGPVVETFEDKLERVADGQGLAVLPAGDQRSKLRHDLTSIPIAGAEPCRVVIAVRRNEPNRLVAAFRECALQHLRGRPDIQLAPSTAA